MPKLTESTQRRRRGRILDAAASCFERGGFHATTIPDICAEAEVSTGAVYTWFDSKQAIVTALAERATANRTRLVEGWSSSHDLTAGLAGLVATWPGSRAARLDAHLWSAAVTDDELRRLAVTSIDRSTAVLARLLDRGSAEGGPSVAKESDGQQASEGKNGEAWDDEAEPRAALLMAALVGLEVLAALDSPQFQPAELAFRHLMTLMTNPTEKPTEKEDR